jgi:hypothetical protein
VSSFNDLVDANLEDGERERLQAVHDMLVVAGPPPELSGALRTVRQPGVLHELRPRMSPKMVLIAAALLLLVVTFSIGFASGQRHTATARAIKTLTLKGTAVAPRAKATLDVLPEVGGNYPMTLQVSGLPRVAAPEYYYVYLVRDGKPLAPCGEFVVAKPSGSLTLSLTAPYKLKRGDTWIVSRKSYKVNGAGSVVLRPA